MTKLTTRHEENLFDRVAQIIEAARGTIARSVNSAMVNAYWLVGREIVEVEQSRQRRAPRLEEQRPQVLAHHPVQHRLLRPARLPVPPQRRPRRALPVLVEVALPRPGAGRRPGASARRG